MSVNHFVFQAASEALFAERTQFRVTRGRFSGWFQRFIDCLRDEAMLCG